MSYSEEQLIDLRSTAVVPSRVDFEAFTKAIEEQRLYQLEHADEHEGRRRSSVQGARPVFRHARMKPREKVVPQADEDGWFTYSKKKQGSVSGEEATQSRDEFRDAAKIAKARQTIGTRQVDARDLTADKPKSTFNAFAALDSEDEDDE